MNTTIEVATPAANSRYQELWLEVAKHTGKNFLAIDCRTEAHMDLLVKALIKRKYEAQKKQPRKLGRLHFEKKLETMQLYVKLVVVLPHQITNKARCNYE